MKCGLAASAHHGARTAHGPNRALSRVSTFGFEDSSSNAGSNPPDQEVKLRRSSQSDLDWNNAMRNMGYSVEFGGSQAPPIQYPPGFHQIIAVIVLFNAIFLGLSVDLAEESDHTTEVCLTIFDNFFCVAWIVEMIFRLKIQKLGYFHDKLNWVDLFLVLLSIFTAWIAPLTLAADTMKINVAGFRLDNFLMMLSMLKLLRLIKIVRMVPKLYNLMTGFIFALKTVGWVFLALFCILYAGALIMTVIVGKTCDSAYEDWSSCNEHFGTVYKSFYTLFQVMTFESWSTVVARPTLAKKPWLIIFFLGFFAMTSFGLLNVIVGVVVEGTLESADERRRANQLLEEAQIQLELEQIRTLFDEADGDGSGFLDKDEFRTVMAKPKAKQILHELNLPSEYPDKLFDFLDTDGNGTLSVDEFLCGVMDMQKEPSVKDMRTMFLQTAIVHSRVQRLDAMVGLLCGDTSGLSTPRKARASSRERSPSHADMNRSRSHEASASLGESSRAPASVPPDLSRGMQPSTSTRSRPQLTSRASVSPPVQNSRLSALLPIAARQGITMPMCLEHSGSQGEPGLKTEARLQALESSVALCLEKLSDMHALLLAGPHGESSYHDGSSGITVTLGESAFPA